MSMERELHDIFCKACNGLGRAGDPCPFCGSKDLRMSTRSHDGGFCVICTDCGAAGPSERDSGSAYDAWQGRLDESRRTLSDGREGAGE